MARDASFGRWLQQRRKALDLTQDGLGRRVGCSRATIRKIEADARRPSKQVAERLAACLDLAPEDQQAFVTFARTEPSAVPSALPAQSAGRRPSPAPPRHPTNLPLQLTSLIGRERDVA